jgi:LAO/AO transport system kinase
MTELTKNPRAYIRPSPNRCHLGGVTRRTNEAVVLCEAAGYDVVIVETVGVGQSEYLVSDMVDMFCLLIPPAGGDELQGIKRGIVEQSDLIVVNKCDGDLVPAARRIKGEYTSALKYMRRKNKLWRPKVQMVSSLTGDGLDAVWETMQKFKAIMEEDNMLEEKRAQQRKKWMWSYVNNRLIDLFTQHPVVKSMSGHLEERVVNYEISPGTAADILIDSFLQKR